MPSAHPLLFGYRSEVSDCQNFDLSRSVPNLAKVNPMLGRELGWCGHTGTTSLNEFFSNFSSSHQITTAGAFEGGKKSGFVWCPVDVKGA